MNMKKISVILASALALAAFASCNKEVKTAEAPEAAPIRLVVGVEGSAATRATGIVSNSDASEAKVNSLQVFVFNGDALDGYGSSTSKTATVSCTSGLRDIYAVVNAPTMTVTSKAALLSTVSSLENSTSNFQMIGSKTETLKYDGTVSINVDRLAARVVLKSIKNAMENPTYASQFKVVSVYLTNVAGDVDFGTSNGYVVDRWYNRRGYEASNNLGAMTYDNVNSNIASGATLSDAHYFYSMPNGNEGKVGGTWSPRAARLVIRVELAGTLYNYPILLPALESNKSYEINCVTITRPGNKDDGKHDPDDPDDTDEEDPITGFEQNFEIVVNPWTVVLVGDNGEITI